MSKVSIIVPVYNCEDYLASCLDSLLNQTLREIEIICVNDCSTDQSINILNDYSSQHDNISVINYTTNKSAAQARKDGVLASEGKYIMFVDGDDFLEQTACENLYHLMEEHEVDILHFGTNIISEGASASRVDRMKTFVSPYEHRLIGNEVFEKCFGEEVYRFNVWNKIYAGDFCRNVFGKLKDEYLPKANDLYAYFALAYFANSYVGVKHHTYYNYRFGAGSTGKSVITLKQLEVYCHEAKVAKELKEFLEENNAYERYESEYLHLKNNLLNECIWNWWEFLSNKYSDQGFDLLVKYWGEIDVVSGIAKKLDGHRDLVAKRINGAKAIVSTKKEIKTIAIFYHRMALGGVQRVISLLIPMYLEMGYNIVLITDEISETHDYDIDPRVKRVLVPSSLVYKHYEYGIRAKELKKVLLENNVDAMLYHAASNQMLIYDILLVKSLGIPFVLTVHELFSQGMVSLNVQLANRPDIYRLVDKLVVLSKTEQLYWDVQGVKATYIPNPIIEINKSSDHSGYILWLGRLEGRQKQFMDSVKIMNLVAQQMPEAKMLIVGNEVSNNAVMQLQRYIEEHGLQENVQFCGHTKDVDEYYQHASIHLLTSAYESFPMTIVESKSFGVPLVCYEMPYVEMLQEDGSNISVAQGDVKAAAEAIVSILQSEETVAKMGQAAMESIKPFANYDLKEAWSKVFSNLLHEEEEFEMNLYMNNIIRSILFHYKKGVTSKAHEVSSLKRKINELEKRNKALEESIHKYKKQGKRIKRLKRQNRRIKNSMSYRIGRIITYIPRRVKEMVK